MGLVEEFGIDSFLYKENDELKSYELVEINYRKTMGYVLDSLKRFLCPTKGIGQWLLMPRNKTKCTGSFSQNLSLLKDIQFDASKKVGIILLSPGHNRYVSIYIAATSIEELIKLEREVQDTLLK